MTREYLPPLREVRDDVDPLAKLIAAADRDGPSPERLARMGERLSVALDAPSARLDSRNLLRGTGAKWIAGIGVAGIALALVLTRTDREPAPRTVRSEPRTSQVAPRATTGSLPPSLPAQTAGAAEEPAHALQRSNPPAARVRSEKARPLGPDSQTTELALLREAQAALPNSPKLALARLAEHRGRYPHGLLEQEREVLQIEALLNSNRIGAAREAANVFAISFPQSAHIRRIERMLARDTKANVGWESDRDGSTHR